MDYQATQIDGYYKWSSRRGFVITLLEVAGLLEIHLPGSLEHLRCDKDFLDSLAGRITRKIGKKKLIREAHFGHLRFITVMGPLDRIAAAREIVGLLDSVKITKVAAKRR